MLMVHEEDPKARTLDEVGDISGIKLFSNQVLVAIYKRPSKTKGGIILTDKTRDEDIYQGKVGLILSKGPDAFDDPTGKWSWDDVGVGSWVLFRPSDSWAIGLIGEGRNEKYDCRILSDTSVRGIVPHPDMVW